MLTSVLVSQSPLVLGAANAVIPFDVECREIEEVCEEIAESGDAGRSQEEGRSIEEQA